jgi:hypothetical protein
MIDVINPGAIFPNRYPRSLPISEWPEADRKAWENACRPARLKPGGAASHLAQESRDDIARRYGAFLGFLQRTGRACIRRARCGPGHIGERRKLHSRALWPGAVGHHLELHLQAALGGGAPRTQH